MVGSLKVRTEIDPRMEQGPPSLKVAKVALLQVQLLWRFVLVRKADTVGYDLVLAL